MFVKKGMSKMKENEVHTISWFYLLNNLPSFKSCLRNPRTLCSLTKLQQNYWSLLINVFIVKEYSKQRAGFQPKICINTEELKRFTMNYKEITIT